MSRISLILVAIVAVSVVYAAHLPLDNNELDNEVRPSNNNGIGHKQQKKPMRGLKFSTAPPETAHHYPGEKLELRCNVFAYPMPTLQWLKNHMPISEGDYDSNSILQSTDNGYGHIFSTLIIDEISENDEDIYTCLATNSEKTDVASTTVITHSGDLSKTELAELNNELISTPARPRITKHIKAIFTEQGETVVLPCVIKGYPKPEIIWSDHKGMPIEEDDPRAKVLASGELVVSPLQWNDMGHWVCTAKNQFGRDSVKSFIYPTVVSENGKKH